MDLTDLLGDLLGGDSGGCDSFSVLICVHLERQFELAAHLMIFEELILLPLDVLQAILLIVRL